MDGLFDFGWMSVLLIAGQWLRSRFRRLRDSHLPTAMLAGCLALAGGPHGLDWIPFHRTSAGELALAGYPSLLVVILFATMFLAGPERSAGSSRQAFRSAADTLFVGLGVMLGQYGLALTLGAWLLSSLFPEMPAEFALLMPASFAGGPGTAAAVAATMETHHLADALPVGMLLATIGLVAGNVGGMALINLAVRMGWTRLVHSTKSLGESSTGDVLTGEEQASLGRATIHPSSLEALTWPIAVVLATVVLAKLLQAAAVKSLPMAVDLPLFVCAMPAALVVRRVLPWLIPRGNPDDAVIGRIGALATDFLVAFGIASVKLSTIRELGLPILLLAVLGLIYTVVSLWIAGRRLFHNYWFERSIFAYGWNMGVVATGVALLRAVDPQFRSKTLDHFGLAYLVIGPIEIGLVVALPWLAVRNHLALPGALLLIASAICFWLSAVTVGAFTASPTAIRDDESA